MSAQDDRTNPEPEDVDDDLGQLDEQLAESAAADSSLEPESPKVTKKKRALNMALENTLELFHDRANRTFAVVRIKDHRETLPLPSSEFELWISEVWYRATGEPLGDTWKDVASCLTAQARFSGEAQQQFVRVARTDDGNIWIDLCDERGTAVHITAEDWRVVAGKDVSIRFVRANGAQPLPEPRRGGDIREILRFVNLPNDDGSPITAESGNGDPESLILVTGWAMAAFSGRGTYPMLVFHGGQGSAKSTGVRICVQLIDPRHPETRAMPRNPQDLAICGTNSGLVALDNVSGIPLDMSDALCRMLSGSGSSSRRLFSDSGEVLFDVQRPVIMNGIPDFVEQSDLGSRTISIELPSIPATDRRDESTLLREFAERHAYILGAMFDGVAEGLRNQDRMPSRLPRLADAALAGYRAETAFGWDDRFINALIANQGERTRGQLADDPIAATFCFYLDHPDQLPARFSIDHGWTSAMTADWLHAAKTLYGDSAVGIRTARRLTNVLDRLKPALAEIGVEVKRGRNTNRGRAWIARLSPNQETRDA